MHHVPRPSSLRRSTRRLGALAALTLSAAPGVAAPSTASAAPIQNFGVYKLLPLYASQMAVDVASPTDGNFSRMVIRRISSTRDSQRWLLEHVGTTFGLQKIYRLRNQHSGKCLEVAGARTDRDAPIYQLPCHNGLHQEFRIDHLSPVTNVKTLVNQRSQLALDVAAAGTASGTPLIQWDQNGLPNQQFTMQRVG